MPGRSSPLFRRIARHAGLATIFRQPQPGLAPATGSSPSDQTGGGHQIQPVKARLLPADSRLPEALLLPNLPVPGSTGVLDELPDASAQNYPDAASPVQMRPDVPPAVRPEPRSVQPVPQASTQMEAPPAAQVTGPADEDRNWRRLQTIFQRHQEKQQAGSAAEENPESAKPASGVQHLPVEKPETQPENQGAELAAPTGRGESIQSLSQPTEPVARPTPGYEEPNRQAGGHPTPPSGPIQLQTDSSPAGPLPAAKDQARSALRPPSAGQAELDDESADSHPTQSLPLEAVWPVQRTPQEPAGMAGAPTQNRQPEIPEHQPEPGEPSDSPTVVARQPDTRPDSGPATTSEAKPQPQDHGLAHLQQVRSGQPSTSRIEVIPPRRPHPLLKPETSPEKPSVPPEPQSETPEQAPESTRDSAPTIQTHKEPSQIKPMPAPGLPEPVKPLPLRQIPTEIGPLPEDLWHLLGEEPPPAEGDTAPMSPAKSSRDSSTPTSSGPDEASYSSAPVLETAAAGNTNPEGIAIQRAIAAAESHPEPDRPAHSKLAASPAPGEIPLKNVLPPIQHLQTAINIPETGRSIAEEPVQTKEPELDLDELARQVYGQVRRKLEIEFERLHRRT